MNIRMVGTGNAFSKKYDNNNALIESENFRLLIDCGITLPKALHELGLTFGDLDAVLISHIHGDHVGGLEEYAFQMKFNYKRKPVLYIAEPLIKPLWEQTLRGAMIQDEFDSLDHYFDVRPITPEEEVLIHPGLSIQLLQTKHILNKPSYSFLINRRFFYSADMRFDGELLRNLVDQGVETIFHDCQLETPAVVHAGLDELLTLPEDIQRKTKLMHYGDTIEEYRGRTGLMQIVERHKSYPI